MGRKNTGSWLARSLVLLKNKNGILPIGSKVNSIFITGPAADSLDVLLGNYHGIDEEMVTLLEGLCGRVPEGIKVEYRPGCQWTQDCASPVNGAVGEAAGSDLAIVCAGTAPLMEGEESESILSSENGDRADIALPAAHASYIKQLAAIGVKIVLILTGGSPIALGEIEDMVQAIVFVWYPGQEGGRAIADVLFGDTVPSGKLPVTFPKSLADLPAFEDYNMTGRTYRFASVEPLFPFGFGLSYTTFAYADLKLLSAIVKAGDLLPVTVTVTNTGAMEGEEVVQLYLSDQEASVTVPLHNLIGFQRVHLKPGDSKKVRFTVRSEHMMLFDEDGKQKLEPGLFSLTVGGCSPSARDQALGASSPVSAVFNLLFP